jgi:hypothetical protein
VLADAVALEVATTLFVAVLDTDTEALIDDAPVVVPLTLAHTLDVREPAPERETRPTVDEPVRDATEAVTVPLPDGDSDVAGDRELERDASEDADTDEQAEPALVSDEEPVSEPVALTDCGADAERVAPRDALASAFVALGTAVFTGEIELDSVGDCVAPVDVDPVAHDDKDDDALATDDEDAESVETTVPDCVAVGQFWAEADATDCREVVGTAGVVGAGVAVVLPLMLGNNVVLERRSRAASTWEAGRSARCGCSRSQRQSATRQRASAARSRSLRWKATRTTTRNL